ncbi:MAG: uncharacterized protein K0R25_473 [Rickettsiaceae bacterium]|nr:uncharacterized protein [Rickettsiaceae bacterium]
MAGRIFGLGLRHPHHQYIIQNKPEVGFFEIHTENFIADGGPSINFLSKISEIYPLSFHCVGLSLGAANGLDKQHLKNIKNLLDRFKPFLFSDHLSWSNSNSGTSNDLLPVPYTKEALKIFCDNVNQAQDFFGREIMVENPSAYLEFQDSEISEIDFLNEISYKTNCGILLDINNIYVGAKNFGFDPVKYLSDINIDKVREIHLAGHSVYKFRNEEIRIDTHSTHICNEVLELYKNFVKTSKINVPTLIEWDEEIPEFEVLFNEMEKVRKAL